MAISVTETRGTDWRLRVCQALAAVLIVWVWVLPMANSFWLDETLVAVLIKGTLAQALSNTALWPQSFLFSGIEWIVLHIGGSSSEIVLRLPSLFAALATLYVWYRVGLECFDRDCGVIFATLYALLPQVARQVPSARPYPLGLLAETAALLFLLRWLKSHEASNAFLWSVCSAIAVHFQITFGLAFGIELLFVFALSLYKRSLNVWAVLGWATVTVALVTALVPQTLMIFRERRLLEMPLAAPGIGELLRAAVPVVFIPIVFVLATDFFDGLIEGASHFAMNHQHVERIGQSEPDLLSSPGDQAVQDQARGHVTVVIIRALSVLEGASNRKWNWDEAFLLGLALMLIPIFGFFALSHLGTASVFVPRYLLPAAPGLIIVWGLILWSVRPRWLRGLSLLASVLLAALIAARSGVIPHYQQDDWKAAAGAVKTAGSLIVYPGLVETRRLDWLDAPQRWPFLIAPALAYRPDLSPKTGLVLPFNFGAEEKADVKRRLGPRLEGQKSVAIIARDMYSGQDWVSWISEQARADGFRRISVSRFGIVDVVIFNKV
ncbi:MAG: glycosyltransferase family 39 protein [Bryobacteraceae bacterium]